MANPNLAILGSMLGEVEQYTPTTTRATATTNASASGQIYKVDSIHVANITGSGGSNEGITVEHTIDPGGTPTRLIIADGMVITPNSALQVLSAPMWLKENEALELTATANSTLTVLISYTVFSE